MSKPTKKQIVELAAFMCESGIHYYGKCVKYDRVNAAAIYMRETFTDEEYYASDFIWEMSESAQLEIKIYYALLIAETL